MNCKKVRKKYLLYLDNELGEVELHSIKQHLKNCPNCAQQLKVYSRLYQPRTEHGEKTAPDFLWEKIYLKISASEKNLNPFSGLLQNLPRYAMTTIVIILFGLAVATGFFLGKQSVSKNANLAAMNSDVQIQNEVTNEILIDSFDDLPPNSLGAVYLTIKSE